MHDIAASRIFQAYKDNNDTMKLADGTDFIFQVKSETTPDYWYFVNLTKETCSCFDVSSTCKHILATKMVAQEFFVDKWKQHMSLASSSQDMGNKDWDMKISMEEETIEPIKEPTLGSTTEHDGLVSLLQTRILELRVELEKISRQCQAKVQKLSCNEIREIVRKVGMVQATLASCGETTRPTKNSMPRRGSIRSIQQNVTRTRMGHFTKFARTSKTTSTRDKFGSHVEMEKPMRSQQTKVGEGKKHARVQPPMGIRVKCINCSVSNLLIGNTETIPCKNCNCTLTRKVEGTPNTRNKSMPRNVLHKLKRVRIALNLNQDNRQTHIDKKGEQHVDVELETSPPIGEQHVVNASTQDPFIEPKPNGNFNNIDTLAPREQEIHNMLD